MSATETEPLFSSLAALRAEHRRLQKVHREAPDSAAVFEQIETFIRRGAATGAILDSDSDQVAAQSLLDFWATTLYRASRTVPESTLAPFNPDLAPTLEDSDVPYVGLDAFVEHKHDVFFGRERAVDALVSRLKRENLIAVIGPSGSGKSSLVLAGLLPALKAGRLPGSDAWQYLGRMVPGSDALANLARVLRRSASASVSDSSLVDKLNANPDYLVTLLEERWPATPTVLVVDQFEELSTLTEDAVLRAAFENAIVRLVTTGSVRHVVILTMRSDFIGAVASESALQKLLETALDPVTPLSAAELREAIERPAQRIGLKFEEGVVEALVHDILGEPAALPLLQFTLLKLWERREHNRVTLQAYRELGGGRLALTNTADKFIQGLIPEDRVMAERIFLQLVRPGTGHDYVAKRVRRRSLYSIGPAQHVNHVLNRLIEERLVRLTGEIEEEQEVEIAHEALGRNWQHLIRLLERDREQLELRRRLEVKAAEWVRLGRGEAGLLKSAALLEAEAWVARPGAEAFVSDDLRALIKASRNAADAALRRQRGARFGLAALAILALGLAVIAGFGWWNARQSGARAVDLARRAGEQARLLALAESERAEALRQQADQQQTIAEQQRILAEEQRKLANEAHSAAVEIRQQAAKLADQDRRLIRQQEQQISAERQQQALLSIAEQEARVKARLYDAENLARSASEVLSDDPQRATLLALQGFLLLTSNKQEVLPSVQATLYQSLLANRLRVSLPASNAAVLGFSSDGRRVVTSGNGEPLRIWDAITGKLVLTIPVLSPTTAAFSLDNRELAVAARSVEILDAATGKHLRSILDAGNTTRPVFERLAFSPDSLRLAGVDAEGRVHLWNIGRGSSAPRESTVKAAAGGLVPLKAESDLIRALAFSPTGAFLATGGSLRAAAADGRRRGSVRIWDAQSGAEIAAHVPEHPGAVTDLAFHPDVQRLISASDNRVRVWRPFVAPQTPESAAESFDVTGEVRTIALTPGGGRVLAFSGDAVTTLDLGPVSSTSRLSMAERFALPAQASASFRFSPDVSTLATGSDSSGIRLWNVHVGSGVVLGTGPEPLTSLTSSSRDTYVTSGSGGTIRYWNLAQPGRELASTLTSPPGRVVVALNPDGTRLATSCLPNCGIRLHNLSSPASAQAIEIKEPIQALAFDHTGAILGSATGAGGSTLRLWDVATGKALGTARQLPVAVSSLAFSRDHTRVAAAGIDGNAFIFPRASSELREPVSFRADPTRVLALTFSPDGASLVTAGADRTMRFWKLAPEHAAKPEAARVLSGHTGGVRSVAFSVDGTLLASGGDDRALHLWSLDASKFGTNLMTITVGPRPISGVAFSRDSSGILVSSEDGAFRWFPTPVGTLLPWALSSLTRAFNSDECRAEICDRFPGAIEHIVNANRLAKEGDVRGAVAEYQAAITLAKLPLDAERQAMMLKTLTDAEAQRHEARALRVQIEALASAGRRAEALDLLGRLSPAATHGLDIERLERSAAETAADNFRGLAQIAANTGDRAGTSALLTKALLLNRDLKIDVDAEVKNMLNDAASRQVAPLVNTWNILAAVTLLEQLRKAGVEQTTLDTNPVEANRFCWRGSLLDLELARHPEVRRACKAAVDLTKGNHADYRDSRGVNAARNGDFKTAIEDFKAFISDENMNPSARAQRRRWIQALLKGTNPFTPDELRSLR